MNTIKKIAYAWLSAGCLALSLSPAQANLAFAGDSSAPGGIALSAPTTTSVPLAPRTVPEPETLLLLLMGLGGWALAQWRLRARLTFKHWLTE